MLVPLILACLIGQVSTSSTAPRPAPPIVEPVDFSTLSPAALERLREGSIRHAFGAAATTVGVLTAMSAIAFGVVAPALHEGEKTFDSTPFLIIGAVTGGLALFELLIGGALIAAGNSRFSDGS